MSGSQVPPSAAPNQGLCSFSVAENSAIAGNTSGIIASINTRAEAVLKLECKWELVNEFSQSYFVTARRDVAMLCFVS